MSMHLFKAIENLKKKVLALSTLVEESVSYAVKSLEKSDEELARKVIDSDDDIDQMEIDVEEEALRILALYQPVAVDLRFIASVLKLNNDLERIGDLAVSIARRSIQLSSADSSEKAGIDFTAMYEFCCEMLKNSLDSLIHANAELALKVCRSDEELDKMMRSIIETVKERAVQFPGTMESMVNYIAIAHSLERIGDHATNIAEDVIYMVQAKIICHKHDTPVITGS